jgi:predicted tellurium resistance membrane protein TerC
MGIGLGIVLLLVGLVLVLNVVNFDLNFVNDEKLGWLLIIVGVLAIVLVLVMNAQRSRTKHVEERRYDGPPPTSDR